ncbi:sugar O-acetyltransferase [Lactobacillus halodurans]|uniref:Sugar O-acetyltransferase n=1 Tax=Companilactobacillus halodurans TaxID=2584183 RepID=A0A5P0ZX18_9LACO|nr:sugar O-acetyltransferase [Companilactobacillus halodurans]MQS97550.1 sugar O-acetyltransferase [Companilactobacillus halodurans]
MIDRIVEENSKIITKINQTYHSKNERRQLFSHLFGYQIPSTTDIKAPFNADLGCHTFVKDNVFINKDCFFIDLGGIWIDSNVKLGPRVNLITANHDENPSKRQNLITHAIHIKNNAWLGANVTVLPGVTIGENSIVGASSVVTKNVEPNSIVVGSPAKKIRQINFEK